MAGRPTRCCSGCTPPTGRPTCTRCSPTAGPAWSRSPPASTAPAATRPDRCGNWPATRDPDGGAWQNSPAATADPTTSTTPTTTASRSPSSPPSRRRAGDTALSHRLTRNHTDSHRLTIPGQDRFDPTAQGLGCDSRPGYGRSSHISPLDKRTTPQARPGEPRARRTPHRPPALFGRSAATHGANPAPPPPRTCTPHRHAHPAPRPPSTTPTQHHVRPERSATTRHHRAGSRQPAPTPARRRTASTGYRRVRHRAPARSSAHQGAQPARPPGRPQPTVPLRLRGRSRTPRRSLRTDTGHATDHAVPGGSTARSREQSQRRHIPVHTAPGPGLPGTRRPGRPGGGKPCHHSSAFLAAVAATDPPS